MAAMTPEAIISALDLKPHPEGGYYTETFRDTAQTEGRSASTAIYYLMIEGHISDWHKVDAAEIWHHYAGAPLALRLVDNDEPNHILLGPDLTAGQRPQAVVPANVWQSATTLGAWTLVGCTVAPGFQFEGFHLATEERKRTLEKMCAKMA